MRVRAWGAAAVLVLLTGCGSAGPVAGPSSPGSASATGPYTGPLYLAPDELTTDTDRATGAAGRVVSCRTQITGDRDDPTRGHEGAPAGSPAKALTTAYGEGRVPTSVTDFALERQDDDRALFTDRVDGVVKQALVMHHGPTLDRGGTVGWYLETSARCDWSELPEDVHRFIGGRLQFWTGADGLRAPTYDIVSFPGAEHCDWQSMTMLHLGGMDQLTYYVRTPSPELADYFAEPYRADVAVPRNAVDTGYSRNGAHLWRSTDGQRAYVGAVDHAELWPVTSQPLGCA